MIDTVRPDRERIDQLLADRALFGLSGQEQSELDSVLPQFPDVDIDCFDRIAAAVDLSYAIGSIEPMPAGLQGRVRQRAFEYFATEHGQGERQPAKVDAPTRRTRFAYRESAAWVLAVAAVAAAVVLWFSPRWSGKAPSVAQLRERIIRETDNVVLVDWQRTGDPTAETATGDVVWSNAEQQGYLRFRDLQKNNPDRFQYQLWIFDAQRDDRYPIDGGVFDIRAEQEETIVPIRAQLKVLRPAMFAITVEQPGGVVVSDRERICLVAKLDG
jgi:hypothetical protein